jgi:hypothetical protein
MTLLLNVDVPDLDAAESFFSAAFGLQTGRRFGADSVELLGWPVALYLLKRRPGRTAPAAMSAAMVVTGRPCTLMWW